MDFKELKIVQEDLRRENDELAMLNDLVQSIQGSDDVFAYIIANQVRFSFPHWSACIF